MEHDDKKKVTENCYGMKWTDIKQYQHRYIVNIPENLEKNIPVDVELPMPVFDPVQETDYVHNELFKPKPKLDTRLAYYKKLYAKTNKPLLRKAIKGSNYATLPQYVIDVARGAFDDKEDHAWCFTGGTLDCLAFNNNTYVARAGLHQAMEVTDLSNPNITVRCELQDNTPIYSLKSVSYEQDALLSVRQKHKITLFCLSREDDGLEARSVWKTKTSDSSFVDVAINEFRRTEVAALDASHYFKIKDFVKNREITSYDFATGNTELSDRFAQITYIDRNTVAFINCSNFSILDLRSLDTKNLCLKSTWLQCDDICTFTKNQTNLNYMYVSSLHNLTKLDLRSLKCVNKVTHMLSTPPFMSTCVSDDNGEYICLSGQFFNDKVLMYSSSESLSMPRYIPNTKDAFTVTALTRKLNLSPGLEERLSLPTLGMKLHKDDLSSNIVLYTLNSVGDVFSQRFLHVKPSHRETMNRLVEWSNALHFKPKVLEATSICNLSNIMHTISSNFSEAKLLRTFMKENRSQKRFEEKFCGTPKYLEGSVGESMNAIWDVDTNIASEIASTLPSTSKVSEWLHSVP